MKSILFAFALLGTSVIAFGQDITIKPSPASDALVAAAKEMNEEQKAFDTAIQQARNTLEASQKQLGAQLQAAQKDLDDKLKADKKYAPLVDNIHTLEKQLADLQQQAQIKFSQSSAPMSSKIATDKALIDGLVPIVRKENDLPSTATFDSATQKWSGVDKPAEVKK
jgi:DNA repair ATPase RecN